MMVINVNPIRIFSSRVWAAQIKSPALCDQFLLGLTEHEALARDRCHYRADVSVHDTDRLNLYRDCLMYPDRGREIGG